MAVNPSKVRTLYDAAPEVVLRDVADGAEAATATEAGVSLNELNTAYWHANEIPNGVMKVMVNVTASDAGTGNETYQLDLLVDDTSDMSNSPVVVGTLPVPRGFTGTLYAYVDSKSIPLLDPDTDGGDKWLAIRATLGGTTPSITYGAALVGVIHP